MDEDLHPTKRRIVEKKSLSDTKWVDLYTEMITTVDETSEGLKGIVAEIFVNSDMLPETWGKNNCAIMGNMITAVRNSYNGNKYHSFAHACHVTLNCAKILLDAAHQSPHITRVEGLALLFAALIHDIGHLGVSNETLVNENHELAMLYSDQSVAEMNSLACAFQIINIPDQDIRCGMSAEERKAFRTVVIDLVLSTNICDYDRQRLLQQRLDTAMKIVTSAGAIELSAYSSRLTIYNLIIRAADVGASMQNAETSRIWSHRFFLEQRDALIAGRGPRVDGDDFCFQHGKFMERHAAALANSLTSTGALSPSLSKEITDSTSRNIAVWKIEGPAIVRAWCAESPSTAIS